MQENMIMNVLISNSNFQKQAHEVAQFITKIYNSMAVLNNEFLAEDKKILFFGELVCEVNNLRISHGLTSEGVFSFFNQMLCKVDEYDFRNRLQAVLIEKILLPKIDHAKIS
jgi:hypothetical protein